jgi:hypothetical protein
MSFDTKQRRPVAIVPSSGKRGAIHRTGSDVSSISGQRYFTMSVVTFSHVGHRKVRLSWPGASGSIRSSHIVAPHFGQVGRRRTRRAGSKDSHSDIAFDSGLKWRAGRHQQTTRQTKAYRSEDRATPTMNSELTKKPLHPKNCSIAIRLRMSVLS